MASIRTARIGHVSIVLAAMLPGAGRGDAGIRGQGNDWHEHLVPNADGIRGTVLHLGGWRSSSATTV
jgi:hypothetical protein